MVWVQLPLAGLRIEKIMANYDFKSDLPVAKKTEKDTSNILINKFDLKILGYNDDYRYDVLVETKKGRKIKIEIKEDFYCEKSGNVALEYESRGFNSGISHTEAELYIYRIHEPNGKISYCCIKTSTLMKMITDKKYFRMVVGGDVGSDTKNYLFKLNIFKNNAEICFY